MCCSCKSWFGFQELEAIKARVREMEKEDERLKELQLEAESRLIMSSEAGTGCPWVLLSPQGHLWGTGWQLEPEHVALPLLVAWDCTCKVGEGQGPRRGVMLMQVISTLTSYLCRPRCSKLI